MRLFVDCDDTLILYSRTGINPHGVLFGTPYVVNDGLVAFVRRIAAANPDALIVIWSGGGGQYAEVVAKIAGLDDIAATYMVKDHTTYPLVRAEDIVFDDQDIKVPAIVWRPDELHGPEHMV